MAPGQSSQQPSGSKGRKHKKGRRNLDDDDNYRVNDRRLLRPPEQEKLPESQLNEEIFRTLTAYDQQKNNSRILWNFIESEYQIVEDNEHTIHMFHMDSELVFKDFPEDEPEYISPLTDEIEDPEDKMTVKRNPVPVLPPPPPPKPTIPDGEEEEEDEEHETMGDIDFGDPLLITLEQAVPEEKVIIPPFRAIECLTEYEPYVDKSMQTVPPVRQTHKNYCNAWVINDLFEKDVANRPKVVKKHFEDEEEEEEEGEEEKKEEEEVKVEEPPPTRRFMKELKRKSVLEGAAAQEAALAKSAEGLKILERLVMQNIFNDVVDDFRYYDDPSDEFRETGEGTILPLWKFYYNKAKRHHVTSISWSWTEPDLFAVSYGSYNYTHPVLDGMLLIWSLRNTAFPEHIWMSPKGVMTCAMHTLSECLVAVGLYDGNVALLQLQEDEENSNRTVIRKNAPIEMKHRSPIWSVRWADNDMNNNPNFYSCSMDGQVIHWVLNPLPTDIGGGLSGTPISSLHLPLPPVQGPYGTNYKLFGCGRCMAVHPFEHKTFLVGTAEGNIFQCSMEYGSHFQKIYNAHFLPVAAVEWNYYHADVFLSCSEDWTIKVWDRNEINPMYVFEIGVPILDCAWAPFSSTVFGAVSEEGKALVYDLSVNKEKPCCCQQVVTKKKVHPNRIAFNPYYPIIIIGDDRGQLTTLKLSPNLRIVPRDAKTGKIIFGPPRSKEEEQKMSRLLYLVRDPESVSGGGGDNQQSLAAKSTVSVAPSSK